MYAVHGDDALRGLRERPQRLHRPCGLYLHMMLKACSTVPLRDGQGPLKVHASIAQRKPVMGDLWVGGRLRSMQNR